MKDRKFTVNANETTESGNGPWWVLKPLRAKVAAGRMTTNRLGCYHLNSLGNLSIPERRTPRFLLLDTTQTPSTPVKHMGPKI